MAGNNNPENTSNNQGDRAGDHVKDGAQPQSWNMVDLFHGSDKKVDMQQSKSADMHLPSLSLAIHEEKYPGSSAPDIHSSVVKDTDGNFDSKILLKADQSTGNLDSNVLLKADLSSGNLDSRVLLAGGTADQVMQAGGSIDQLIRAGGSVDQIIRAGGSTDQIMQAGGSVDQIAMGGGSTDKNDPNYHLRPNGKTPMVLEEPKPGLNDREVTGIMMPRDPNNPEKPMPSLKRDPDVLY